MATATQQKVLGAFYTADPVARFLVRWAIRRSDDTVLDPSCGDGVFLSAAGARLLDIGSTNPQIWGVDVNPSALRNCRLRSTHSNLLERDFFALKRGDLPAVAAVVGNPPFIRYQTFKGKQRAAALESAAQAGVRLPQLSSSWAPFVVHASTFLRTGGRLAMVVPAEFMHAQYATEVIGYMVRKFARITVRMFQTKMFEALSEDTVLLLCDGYGQRCEWLSITPADCIEDADPEDDRTVPVDIEAVRSGNHRLTRYLLSPRARHLYEGMASQEGVVRLGDAAEVGIGYVTGCNDYFHLTALERKTWRIPARYLKPAVLSLRDFQGTVFRRSDWERRSEAGEKSHLLAIPDSDAPDVPNGLLEYLSHGRKQGVQNRFKCRVRQKWYSVPHIKIGDAFLSYMSGSSPKLVRNAGAFVAPNTLHIVQFDQGRHWSQFVAGWQSSLTKLSCEIEGHALGGGLLKLEPTEAENVRIALPSVEVGRNLVGDLTLLLREGKSVEATDLADRVILRGQFGLSNSECGILGGAARQLEKWRLHR